MDGLITGADGRRRCAWCGDDPLYVRYHDEEWGRAVREERLLFEKLCLEGFQAGLSWITILRKREAFRAAFAGFDWARVARYTPKKVEALLADPGIVRHRGKIESTLNNARRVLELHAGGESLSALVWRFAPDPRQQPARPTWTELSRITRTPESTALSRELKRRGFSFVGPTTMHALMQAMGLVNDHVHGCHARAACRRG